MRTFADGSGIQWTVFEVQRAASDARGSSSSSPTGRFDGWLCFEGPHSKRRLAEFPEHWRELSDAELDALCESATPAQRSQRILGLDPDVEAQRPHE
jgi:hypothetical protein